MEPVTTPQRAVTETWPDSTQRGASGISHDNSPRPGGGPTSEARLLHRPAPCSADRTALQAQTRMPASLALQNSPQRALSTDPARDLFPSIAATAWNKYRKYPRFGRHRRQGWAAARRRYRSSTSRLLQRRLRLHLLRPRFVWSNPQGLNHPSAAVCRLRRKPPEHADQPGCGSGETPTTHARRTRNC